MKYKSLKAPVGIWVKLIKVAKKHSRLKKLTQTQVFEVVYSILAKK